MKQIFKRHRSSWGNRQFTLSALSGFLLLSASLIVNYFAIRYATKEASNAVTDILLSNLPIVNIDEIFVEGSIIFWIFILFLLIHKPKYIPFVFKSVALFILVRSIFISLTHIGPFPYRASIDAGGIFKIFTLGGDLFFSGHTGSPFLLALIFWDKKILRNIFLVCTFIFAASVILGHLHYSIDVFAAFFITYGIYHMCLYLFRKDYKAFKK